LRCSLTHHLKINMMHDNLCFQHLSKNLIYEIIKKEDKMITLGSTEKSKNIN